MKSASKNWIFICLALVIFNCGSNKPHPEVKTYTPMEKAYVLLRTEGSEQNITQVKDILNSDFVTNNISTNIITYPLERAWNNTQIFTTAYNDKYDYIILIDQVAKFTIDNKTQVGGKYQIRSYHIKSPNPEWIDLGQKTCNVTVKPSIKKFAQQIVSNIVPNYKSSTVSINEDEMYADNSSNTNSGYQALKSSKEIDDEIKDLKHQLKLEREKTNDIIAEKERLAKQYEEALIKEKRKTELALANLKIAEKKKAKATQLKAEEELANSKKLRQKEIADAYAVKREKIRQKEVEEALKNPEVVVAEEIKEPTREERIRDRQEVKQRLADERAKARKKQEEDAFKRQEEKRRLVEEKRNKIKREQEALINKKKEEKRLTQAKKEEKLLKLKKKQEDERMTKLNEEKRITAEKEKLALAKAKEEEEQEEQLTAMAEAKRTEQANKEEEKRLAKLLKEEQVVANAKLKKEKELIEQKKSKEEERLAQAKKEEEEFELKRQLKEKRRLAELEEKERVDRKQAAKSTTKVKKKKPKKNTSSGKTNALIILRGKKGDTDNLKTLQDNIEFDFLFAKAKATVQILNKEQKINKTTIIRSNTSKFDQIIIVDQLDYKGDGFSNYQISTYNYNTDSNWKDDEVQPFKISEKESIKKLSKTITTSL